MTGKKGDRPNNAEYRLLDFGNGRKLESVCGRVLDRPSPAAIEKRKQRPLRSQSIRAAGIAAAVEEQGSATGEIARNVREAAQGTQEVSSNIAGVTEASQETGHAAEQVLQAAGELSQQSEKLHQEVDRFLGEIRAA